MQVCRRWRNLILASPVRLNLHLICTAYYGTPVVDVLTSWPPLPLIITYLDRDRERTTEDNDAILLALQHCDRVGRVGLVVPSMSLLQPLISMARRFPIPERLFIRSRTGNNMNLMLLISKHLKRLLYMPSCCPTWPLHQDLHHLRHPDLPSRTIGLCSHFTTFASIHTSADSHL